MVNFKQHYSILKAILMEYTESQVLQLCEELLSLVLELDKSGLVMLLVS